MDTNNGSTLAVSLAASLRRVDFPHAHDTVMPYEYYTMQGCDGVKTLIWFERFLLCIPCDATSAANVPMHTYEVIIVIAHVYA